MPGVTLVGVADPDAARAAEIAAAHGTQAFADASALPPVDAVVVAAPTELHAELAGPFLSRGVSVLVEKPVTRTLEEADGLIALAARHGAVLAVGHSERFNPAVAAALPHVDGARLRRGAPPQRLPRAQPRHRRRVRPDDPRPRRAARGDRHRGHGHRGGRRAGAVAAHRHRQRPPHVRVGLHRQPHRQPHQLRYHPQGALLPAARLHRHRLREEGSRALSGRGGRRRGGHRRRQAGRRRRPSRCSSSSRTSSTRCGRAGRRASAAPTAAARWSWRIASRPSWPEGFSREAHSK